MVWPKSSSGSPTASFSGFITASLLNYSSLTQVMQNPRIPEWLRLTGPLEVALSNPVLQHREPSPMPRRPLQGGALSTLGQPVPGLRHLPSTDMFLLFWISFIKNVCASLTHCFLDNFPTEQHQSLKDLCKTSLTSSLHCESWPFSPPYFFLSPDQILVILIRSEMGYLLATQFL